MIYVAISLIIIALIAGLYLLAIRPNTGRQKQMEPFREKYIAHRGLFNNADIPENSMSAFRKAVEAGYGIELDVQLTADNQLVVFHDETLNRMCGDERTLYKLSYEELNQLSLLETNERIPLLKDVLALIDGLVPLVVEIKSEGRYLLTSELTNQMLLGYKGIFCVESFHPFVLKWYKKNNPAIIRGQLSTNYFRDGIDRPWGVQLALTNMLFNFMTKPDFIAYNHKFKKQLSYRLCRKFYNPVNVAWTVRSQNELEDARDTFEAFIFDSFIPEK